MFLKIVSLSCSISCTRLSGGLKRRWHRNTERGGRRRLLPANRSASLDADFFPAVSAAGGENEPGPVFARDRRRAGWRHLPCFDDHVSQLPLPSRGLFSARRRIALSAESTLRTGWVPAHSFSRESIKDRKSVFRAEIRTGDCMSGKI